MKRTSATIALAAILLFSLLVAPGAQAHKLRFAERGAPARLHSTAHVIGAAPVAPAPPAPLVTNVIDASTGQPVTGDLQTWLQDFSAPLPAGMIVVHLNADMSVCANPNVVGVDACSTPGNIYMAAGYSDNELAFLHELGHEWDFEHMGVDPLGTTEPTLEPWQQQFETIWGLSVGWWDYMPGTSGGTPGEWFANAYELCGAPTVGAAYAYMPFGFPTNQVALQATCALINSTSN